LGAPGLGATGPLDSATVNTLGGFTFTTNGDMIVVDALEGALYRLRSP
jgi:shikimate kinase